MKAISIQQPWAWAILNAGKDVENRSWSHNYRGPILIHAGKKFDQDGLYFISGLLRHKMHIPCKSEFETGGVVGMVTIKKMVRDMEYSPWMFGPWGWVLEDPKPMDFYPCRGQLGLFNIDIPEKYRTW